jgi:hypothetical protein
MKRIYMIFAVLISCSGLNAMMPDHKMDRHRKRCKDDLDKSMIYMTMNCSPFLFKEIRQNKILFPMVSFLAVAQGYFLYNRFMTYRLAQKGIIDYRS